MSDDLLRAVTDAACECTGWEGLRDPTHRRVFAALVRGLADRPGVTLLVEPSLVRSAERPPDLVVVDPASGVHVIEVKGVALDAIERAVAGEIRVRYGERTCTKSPIRQVRAVMFDIKNAVERALGDETAIPFLWWVVFGNITRESFAARFDWALPELLFAGDLDAEALVARLDRTGQERLARRGRGPLAGEELAAVRRAFGDSAVLSPLGRAGGAAGREGTLGEYFGELAREERALSEEQQRLASGDWRGGPRLIRGVAGSGKTVVLAAHLARRIARSLPEQGRLFAAIGDHGPRCLAVCFNRKLVPFIRRKIEAAYRQRTGDDLPDRAVEVLHFNQLLYRHRGTLWQYRCIGDDGEDSGEERASDYLKDFEETCRDSPKLLESCQYDAIYVDEAQDLHPGEIRLLAGLCRAPGGELAELYLFYDDAQNLYGRPRPVWEQLGVKLKGRSHVMVECHRNTRQIVEPAFNVLLGATAPEGVRVQTRRFADTHYLAVDRRVLEERDGLWRVAFAAREGAWPVLHAAGSLEDENIAVLRRLQQLLEEEDVRPEDVLVLGPTRKRLRQMAGYLRHNLPVKDVLLPFEEGQKDDPLTRRGCLTLSTVNSAKGYDAFCVLLTAANLFGDDRAGRAALYVGCTRAREYLDIFAHEETGLVPELRAALEALRGTRG